MSPPLSPDEIWIVTIPQPSPFSLRQGTPVMLYLHYIVFPDELSFAKGDVLAVLRLQDEEWWEAEVTGKRGRPSLVPRNYLVAC